LESLEHLLLVDRAQSFGCGVAVFWEWQLSLLKQLWQYVTA